MGIRKMHWNEWIEMDSNFIPYHDAKVRELEKDVASRVQYVDNEVTRLACFEVLEELTQYLTHRYPEVFQLQGNILRNTITAEEFQYPASNPTEAMVTAAKLVQDDLVVMVLNDDGHYHIDAGAVCLPGFWRLTEKYRMSLDELHIEAGVPHYQEKLQKAMNRFFANMTCEKPVIRNNVTKIPAPPYKLPVLISCSSSSSSMTVLRGPTVWATKTPIQLPHGLPPIPKVFVLKISTSARKGNRFDVFRSLKPYYLPSEHTSSRLLLSRKSRMFQDGWQRRSGVGTRLSATTREENIGKDCSFHI